MRLPIAPRPMKAMEVIAEFLRVLIGPTYGEENR
jgi:hypothetical protein